MNFDNYGLPTLSALELGILSQRNEQTNTSKQAVWNDSLRSSSV